MVGRVVVALRPRASPKCHRSGTSVIIGIWIGEKLSEVMFQYAESARSSSVGLKVRATVAFTSATNSKVCSTPLLTVRFDCNVLA